MIIIFIEVRCFLFSLEYYLSFFVFLFDHQLFSFSYQICRFQMINFYRYLILLAMLCFDQMKSNRSNQSLNVFDLDDVGALNCSLLFLFFLRKKRRLNNSLKASWMLWVIRCFNMDRIHKMIQYLSLFEKERILRLFICETETKWKKELVRENQIDKKEIEI